MSSTIHDYSFTISPHHGQTQACTVRQLREGKDQKLSNVYKHESGMTKLCVAVWRKRERELFEVEVWLFLAGRSSTGIRKWWELSLFCSAPDVEKIRQWWLQRPWLQDGKTSPSCCLLSLQKDRETMTQTVRRAPQLQNYYKDNVLVSQKTWFWNDSKTPAVCRAVTSISCFLMPKRLHWDRHWWTVSLHKCQLQTQLSIE